MTCRQSLGHRTTQNTFSLLNACNALTTAPNTLSLKLAGLTYGGTPGSCAVTSPYTGIFQTAAVTNGADPVTPIGNDTAEQRPCQDRLPPERQKHLERRIFYGQLRRPGFSGSSRAAVLGHHAHAKSMIIGAHWTWLASSNVVNEAHFGVNRFFQPSYPGDCSGIGQPSGETGINWGTPTVGYSANRTNPRIAACRPSHSGLHRHGLLQQLPEDSGAGLHHSIHRCRLLHSREALLQVWRRSAPHEHQGRHLQRVARNLHLCQRDGRI